MAKIKMICPFSKELCRECPQYRGRHYYLCFHKHYRGYLGNPEKKAELSLWSRGVNRNFDLPSNLPTSPTWLALNEFAERKER